MSPKRQLPALPVRLPASRLSTAMSESDLQTAIIDAAKLYGWRVAHFRPALTAKGWRTPVQGDAGFPDLVLARDGRVIFLELKREGGKVSPEQDAWIEALDNRAGRQQFAGVVYPRHLDLVLDMLQ